MPIHLLQIAKKLAHDAGQMALKMQKHGFKTQEKGAANNLVTEADHACEALILKTIQKNFPTHGILSEEAGVIQGSSDYKWIIDPIDGTNNFAHGIPLFAVSIAVVHKGKPIIGVIDIPGTREAFWAQHGKGAFLNGKPIHVSKIGELKRAMIATGFPYDRTGPRAKKTLELMGVLQHEKQCRGMRRIGAATIDLAYLAAGRLDAYFEYDLKPWDIAAGKIILEEAGGMLTNMDGSKLNPKVGALLASNGILHERLLKIIQASGGHTA